MILDCWLMMGTLCAHFFSMVPSAGIEPATNP